MDLWLSIPMAAIRVMVEVWDLHHEVGLAMGIARVTLDQRILPALEVSRNAILFYFG